VTPNELTGETTKVKLKSGQRDLAGVAQYVRMIRGEPNVFRWVKQILGVDSKPGPVHRYLAHLPGRLQFQGGRGQPPALAGAAAISTGGDRCRG